MESPRTGGSLRAEWSEDFALAVCYRDGVERSAVFVVIVRVAFLETEEESGYKTVSHSHEHEICW